MLRSLFFLLGMEGVQGAMGACIWPFKVLLHGYNFVLEYQNGKG